MLRATVSATKFNDLDADGVHDTPETVREVPQPRWRPTTPAGGAATIFLRALDSTLLDFGNTQRGLITGVKFDDRDGDGVMDAGAERGRAGFTIFADRDDDGVLDPIEERDVTAADGSYGLSVPHG